MKYVLLFAATLSLASLKAQDRIVFFPPDYEEIEEVIQDEDSEYYYPAMMESFLSGDTLLTLEQYHYFYYGFSFQSNYRAYGNTQVPDYVDDMLEEEEISDEDAERFYEWVDSEHLDNPFQTTAYLLELEVADRRGDSARYVTAYWRVNRFLRTIFDSGKGDSRDNPIYVISVPHEYSIMNLMGVRNVKQSLVDHFDKMELAENEYGLEVLWFDITAVQASWSRMMDDEIEVEEVNDEEEE